MNDDQKTTLVERLSQKLAPVMNVNWDAKNFNDTSNGCDPEEDREYVREIARIAIRELENIQS